MEYNLTSLGSGKVAKSPTRENERERERKREERVALYSFLEKFKETG